MHNTILAQLSKRWKYEDLSALLYSPVVIFERDGSLRTVAAVLNYEHDPKDSCHPRLVVTDLTTPENSVYRLVERDGSYTPEPVDKPTFHKD